MSDEKSTLCEENHFRDFYLKHVQSANNFAYYKCGDDEAPNLDTNNQSPEYLFEEEEFKQKLTKAIASLNEAQREVFLLNRIEGKKYREIAELLNISQKTVE